MKSIALLLSFIVLMLTATPCCAFEAEGDHGQDSLQKEKHADDQQSGDCCKDCSPFYVCGTCIGFTFNTQQAITFTVMLKTVMHNTAYVPVELPLIPLAIWQPPKLA